MFDVEFIRRQYFLFWDSIAYFGTVLLTLGQYCLLWDSIAYFGTESII